MVSRSVLKEVVVIRAIACLSVVLLHSIGKVYVIKEGFNGTDDFILGNLQVLLSFATPTFVFLTALILAYSYKESLPKGFWGNRTKLILFPFIAMALFYGVVFSIRNPGAIPQEIGMNLLGNFHAYFVLVIFQFYILFYLFNKYLKNTSTKKVLITSLIITTLYLGFFNSVDAPNNSALLSYVWERGFWVPFPGWLIYFTLAYYFGKNYSSFLNLLERRKAFIIGAVITTGVLVIILNGLGVFSAGSKRVDMMVFTIFVIFLLFMSFAKITRVPFLFETVSKYSFGIYLLHMFFLNFILMALGVLGVDLGYMALIPLFFGSIISSMIVIYILNKFSFGKYLVGAIGKTSKERREAKVIREVGATN